MEKTIVRFLTVTLTTFLAQGLSCSNNLKQGPYTLVNPEQKLPNITKLELEIIKYNLTQETATMMIGYRSRWTSYCYNGGSLDPNTGCIDDLKAYPPTPEELNKWGRENKCEVCDDVSNAWGTDAKICLNNNARCNKWYTRKELTKRSSNNNFAYHTCESSWRCGFSTSQIPLIMKMSTQPDLYVSLPNGTLELVKELHFIDGQTSMLILGVPKIMKTNMQVKCIYESKDYWCIDSETQQSFRVFREKPTFCLYATCYKWISVTSPKKEKSDYHLDHASMQDLKNAFITEMLDVETMKYTLLETVHRLFTVENMLLKTINSIAKIDDRLLQRLLGGSFSTEYINEDKFFIKPCLHIPKIESNCFGEKIFSEGRWVPNSNRANCVNLKNTNEINLFEILDIWLPKISEQKAWGTSDDYAGWSFYANTKSSLIETMQYTRNGGKGTSIKDILDMPEGMLVNTLTGLWGLSMTTIFTIIGLIIMVHCICKRL